MRGACHDAPGIRESSAMGSGRAQDTRKSARRVDVRVMEARVMDARAAAERRRARGERGAWAHGAMDARPDGRARWVQARWARDGRAARWAHDGRAARWAHDGCKRDGRAARWARAMDARPDGRARWTRGPMGARDGCKRDEPATNARRTHARPNRRTHRRTPARYMSARSTRTPYTPARWTHSQRASLWPLRDEASRSGRGVRLAYPMDE
jgi:hypothetical protein